MVVGYCVFGLGLCLDGICGWVCAEWLLSRICCDFEHICLLGVCFGAAMSDDLLCRC